MQKRGIMSLDDQWLKSSQAQESWVTWPRFKVYTKLLCTSQTGFIFSVMDQFILMTEKIESIPSYIIFEKVG